MTRVLLAVSAILGALCLVQWSTLARLKGELALADARAYDAVLRTLGERQDEIARTIGWLDGYTVSEGLAEAALCESGRARVGAVGDAVSYVYLYMRARGAGDTEAGARQRIVDALASGGGGASVPLR